MLRTLTLIKNQIIATFLKGKNKAIVKILPIKFVLEELTATRIRPLPPLSFILYKITKKNFNL